MNDDGLWADRVEDQIIPDNDKTVSHTGEFFIMGDFSKMGMRRKALKVFFDRLRESIGGGRTVRRNVGEDLFKILVGNR